MPVAAFNLVLLNLYVSCISCRTQVSSSGTAVVNIHRREKRKLEEALSIDVHAPEESAYESNSDEDQEGQGGMTKLVVKRFEWR